MDFTFKPCPTSPNCVSSMTFYEDKTHYIDPIQYEQFPLKKDRVMELLLDLLGKESRVRVLKRTEDYIHAEFKTAILGFTDDVEFYLPNDEKIIHIKSASRIGYSDLGTNRKRMNSFKEKFNAAAVSWK